MASSPTTIFRNRQLLQNSALAVIGFVSLLSPAWASDQDSARRHSLILKPVAGRPTDSQPALRAGASSTLPTVASPAAASALPRRLTKRPGQDMTSVASSAQQAVSGAVVPQTTPSNQLPVATGAIAPSTAGIVSMPQAMASSTRGVATVVPTAGVTVPSAAASVAQPAAVAAASSPAASIGSSSRFGGSRSALNLFKIPFIMNLLQAPLPPVVTPPSNTPTTSPPSTSPTSSPPSTPPSSSPTTGSATLSWTLGSESDLAGYKVYVGTSSGAYNYPGSPFTIGRVNTYTLTNLPKGQTYFFSLSAYDSAGNNSPLSAEASKSIF